MSTQESSGDDSVHDLVDAFPPFLLSSRNYSAPQPTPSTLHEAMKIQEKELESGNRRYPITNGRLALIINNESFKPSTKMGIRTGSSKDMESMKNVLGKLGFNVITLENLTINQMRKNFNDISKNDHSQNDCFVCVLLSHGDDGGIVYGTDGGIKLDDLIAYVLPNKCPSLAGKPKLFFVQACRGTKLDEGHEVHDAIGAFGSRSLPPAQKVPLWADMLIAYSSVSGYYSWRNSKNGSWFIQSLAFLLSEHGTKLEIQQIMTKVNFRVAYEYESRSDNYKMNNMKQVPCIASMLTKELYFPPPKKQNIWVN